MNQLLADRPRDNLHRANLRWSASSYRDFAHPTSSRREQRRMPGKESLSGERFRIFLSGVEHHLNHTLNIPARRLRRPEIEP